MKVRAKQLGFYKGNRIRPGAVFDIAEGEKLGKWMEPVTGASVVEKVAGDEPATFSELNATEVSKKTRREQAAKERE